MLCYLIFSCILPYCLLLSVTSSWYSHLSHEFVNSFCPWRFISYNLVVLLWDNCCWCLPLNSGIRSTLKHDPWRCWGGRDNCWDRWWNIWRNCAHNETHYPLPFCPRWWCHIGFSAPANCMKLEVLDAADYQLFIYSVFGHLMAWSVCHVLHCYCFLMDCRLNEWYNHVTTAWRLNLMVVNALA